MNKFEILNYLNNNDIDKYRLEIIQKVIDNNINDNILINVFNTLTKNHDLIEDFLKIIKKYNLNDTILTKINDILYKYDNKVIHDTINNVINNKISIDNYTTIDNVKFIEYGLDNDIKNDLFNINKQALGKGEILLCLLIENSVYNNHKRGDLFVQNYNVEIKSTNARLVNQSDFGNGEDVSNYWINEIRKYCIVLLPEHDNNIRWNLTGKDRNNYLNHYINQLQNIITNKQISEIICNGWDKLFINKKMDPIIIENVLNKYPFFNKEAQKEYYFEIFLYNMQYYLESSEIDYFIQCSENGFLIFKKDFFYSDKVMLRQFCKENLLYSYPMLTKTAGNGRCFSISLLER